MPNDKLLSMLGLARRAGKVSMGFDSAVGSAVKKESALILTAKDISPKSLKELKYALEECQVDIFEIPYDIDDLKSAVGKSVRIISVNDSGFAAQVKRLLNAGKGEE
ncbi:MAG: ribosomal L7Ae/L30e/S12e/Gadd45 family protein [Clostridia bacterium]|nr:ribosomal L7Ae/L30e/S12e/Gadd45 family protein [Clostridia bacterium]